MQQCSAWHVAGEQLVEQLAPELVPMLASLESPANFVPLTNAVLAEMARRGVHRQQILTTLRRMGQDLPEASLNMIKVRLPLTADPANILGCFSAQGCRHDDLMASPCLVVLSDGAVVCCQWRRAWMIDEADH